MTDYSANEEKDFRNYKLAGTLENQESGYSTDEVKDRWDANAELYAANSRRYGDTNKEVILVPTFLEMLGDVQGMRMLDAGCGEGWLCRLMAEAGAFVTGIDYSEEMLRIARERTQENLKVEYRHENFEQLNTMETESFDAVVSIAAIQDIPDYAAALCAAYRVLRPGGFFLLALLHPCFAADGGWVKDENGKKLYWKIDNYFREQPSEMTLCPAIKQPILYFHRTLTSYFREIIATGFTVESLVEPTPSEEAIQRYPEFANDFRMSHYLILKLKK